MLGSKQQTERCQSSAEAECTASKRVLVAKPQKGSVDYTTLRSKIAARFPKVLARLAE
jgi:hypothetical protein